MKSIGTNPYMVSSFGGAGLGATGSYSSSAADLRAPFEVEQIDLLGGNGNWRQRRAKEEWQRQEQEKKEQQREQQRLEEERERRRQELANRKRRQREEEERRRREEREAIERKQREDRIRQEEQEREERRKKDEKERERIAMMPKTCQACKGSGACPACQGSGHLFATFLAPRVCTDSLMQHGRVMQGCQDCGGYRQNIVGDLQMGNGRCAACDGVGKISPKPMQGDRVRGYRRNVNVSGLDSSFFSPKSPVGAASPSGNCSP